MTPYSVVVSLLYISGLGVRVAFEESALRATSHEEEYHNAADKVQSLVDGFSHGQEVSMKLGDGQTFNRSTGGGRHEHGQSAWSHICDADTIRAPRSFDDCSRCLEGDLPDKYVEGSGECVERHVCHDSKSGMLLPCNEKKEGSQSDWVVKAQCDQLHDPPRCTCSTLEEQDSTCSKLVFSQGKQGQARIKAAVKDAAKAGRSTVDLSHGWSLRLSVAEANATVHLTELIHRAIDAVDDAFDRRKLCKGYQDTRSLDNFFSLPPTNTKPSFMLYQVNIIHAKYPHAVSIGGLQRLSIDQVTNWYNGYTRGTKNPEKANTDHVANVVSFYTDVSCQGLGLAGWVMKAVLELAKTWELRRLVLRASGTAPGFYERYGFTPTGDPITKFHDKHGNPKNGSTAMEQYLD